jgi:DNA replication protein DnaC
MLIHPLAERLRAVGMAAMADAFLEMQSNADAAGLTREDWLGLLLDCEVTARDSKRLGRRLSQARLRQNAVVEDTDFRAPRGLDRALFHKLAGCADDRYEKGSLLVTSQIPVSRWHELVGDPTIGDALLDRIVHRAHRIELKGPSLRKRQAVSASVERDSANIAG